MKLERQTTLLVTPPMEKELYFSIYNPHTYHGYANMEFCIICDHSKEVHHQHENKVGGHSQNTKCPT